MRKSKQQDTALKILKGYRAVLCRKTALEAVYRANDEALLVCLEQIQLTNELVDSLKSDTQKSKKMYWIIYATFMTDKQLSNVEEILGTIAEKYERIPRRTYFRLKKQAIERLNELLGKQYQL